MSRETSVSREVEEELTGTGPKDYHALEELTVEKEELAGMYIFDQERKGYMNHRMFEIYNMVLAPEQTEELVRIAQDENDERLVLVSDEEIRNQKTSGGRDIAPLTIGLVDYDSAKSKPADQGEQ